MKNRFLLAASALLGAVLGQTSCHAPAPPAPKSEPITVGQQATAHKPTPAKPTSQPAAAPRQVAVRARELGPAYFPHFVEKPHRRKVKYGKHRWVMV